MKVFDVKPITMPEAREILAKVEKQKELGYEQKVASEHLKKFTKIELAEAKKMVDELSSTLRMSPETMVQIVNIMPKTPDELRMIFAREKFSLKEDEMNKILEIVKKYT